MKLRENYSSRHPTVYSRQSQTQKWLVFNGSQSIIFEAETGEMSMFQNVKNEDISIATSWSMYWLDSNQTVGTFILQAIFKVISLRLDLNARGPALPAPDLKNPPEGPH